mmetsp:Transcript_34324/g.106564  ORF Transcript_34324/g.106564 Transcript_34324/m.106564 type:complete len:263 (+) Transcript_34324:416-1204(+)
MRCSTVGMAIVRAETVTGGPVHCSSALSSALMASALWTAIVGSSQAGALRISKHTSTEPGASLLRSPFRLRPSSAGGARSRRRAPWVTLEMTTSSALTLSTAAMLPCRACNTLGSTTKTLTLSTARDILPTNTRCSVAPLCSVAEVVVVVVMLVDVSSPVAEDVDSSVVVVVVGLLGHELGHFSPQMSPTLKLVGRAGTAEAARPSQLPTISRSKKQSVIRPPVTNASTPPWKSWHLSLRQAAWLASCAPSGLAGGGHLACG